MAIKIRRKFSGGAVDKKGTNEFSKMKYEKEQLIKASFFDCLKEFMVVFLLLHFSFLSSKFLLLDL